MRVGSTVFLSLAASAILSTASPVHAQESSWDVGVSAAAVNYDLSGTGTTAGIAVHGTHEVWRNVALELRGLFARPDQQSGVSTLFIPEAQVQYRWNIGRVSPYVGGGAGFAAVKSPLRTDWDPTFSAAVGTGVRLTERVGLTGEMRLRGIETRFTGSTAEWSVGLAWRMPSF